MSAVDFFDSNILLYIVSKDTAKADKASALLADGGTVSIQVLDEFASVAMRKLGQTMQETREVLADIRDVCEVAVADLETHELGLEIAERYKFSIYDAMLLAAAVKAGCRTFYTEDLQHGQTVEGVMVKNPFE